MKTYSPIQGMHCCANDSGGYVEKTDYDAVQAELDGIRALADRRNERDHSQDTTHQLVAALDQALDIAQAELATERARLRQIALDACRAAAIVPLVWYPAGHYINPNDLGKINKQQVDACVAAIDAAMKEEKTK